MSFLSIELRSKRLAKIYPLIKISLRYQQSSFFICFCSIIYQQSSFFGCFCSIIYQDTSYFIYQLSSFFGVFCSIIYQQSSFFSFLSFYVAVRPFCSICWRLCFLSCCLPTCYTCYLTRSLRRRRRKIHRPHIKADTDSNPSNGIAKPFNDDLNQTMLRTVSNTRKRRTTQAPANDAEQASDENVIKLNVIILNSATGRSLQMNLYGSDVTDGPDSRPVSSRVVLRRHTSLQAPQAQQQQQVSFSPVLTAVRESFEGSSGDVSGNVPPISRSTSVTQEERNSATRRWSQLGAFGTTVARLSRALKKAKEDEITVIDEEEIVTLRKELG